jgi:hypothetical protein
LSSTSSLHTGGNFGDITNARRYRQQHGRIAAGGNAATALSRQSAILFSSRACLCLEHIGSAVLALQGFGGLPDKTAHAVAELGRDFLLLPVAGSSAGRSILFCTTITVLRDAFLNFAARSPSPGRNACIVVYIIMLSSRAHARHFDAFYFNLVPVFEYGGVDKDHLYAEQYAFLEVITRGAAED